MLNFRTPFRSPWAGLLYNVVRDTVSILLATFVCRKTGLTRMVFAVVMVVNGVAFFFMAFLGVLMLFNFACHSAPLRFKESVNSTMITTTITITINIATI